MKPFRLAFGACWLVTLAALQLWQSITSRDDWPLSSFPMYSGKQGPHITKGRTVAVGPSGEFALADEHLAPLSPRTIGMALRHSDSKHQPAIRRAVAEHYYRRLANGEHHGPMLSSLRQYEDTWRVSLDVSNRDKPKVSLKDTVPALAPVVLAQLDDEAHGRGQIAPALPATSDTLVLEASAGQLGGTAALVNDAWASEGTGVNLSEQVADKAKLSAEPAAYVDWVFEAPPGRYLIWIRGKSLQSKERGSIWLQFDNEIGSAKSQFEGLGNFRKLYPKGAFGWSSETPLNKPAGVRLQGTEPHRLRLSLREGPLVIDQLVLSKTWVENPGQMGPATP